MRRGGITTTDIQRAWAHRDTFSVGLAIAVVVILAMAGLFSRAEANNGASPANEPSPTVASPPEDRNDGAADHGPAEPPTTVVATTSSTTPPSPQPDTSTSSEGGATFVVSRVIDGDTVVLDDGRRVRLAQVDAPETNQCYGSQSTAALRELVDGKPVTLRRPPDAPKTDRYGRTLAELFVDGVSADEELIRRGAAEWYEQYAHEDADLAKRLEAAEADAVANERGLWSTCAVGVTPPPVTAPPTTAAPAPQPLFGGGGTGAESSSSSSDCHPGYPDDCIPPGPPDLDCGSAEIRRRVHVDHAYGDPHRFDADKDGWGCESYG